MQDILSGVKEFKCQSCGKMYTRAELEEIMDEVGKGKVSFPPTRDILQCLECWRKKYPEIIS